MRARTATQDAADTRATAPQPVAVVGMAGRFPGAASIDELWQLLCRGGDAVGEVPTERHQLASPATGAPGRWGGFLERVDAFDAEHFGISPREAERMDPQQRLLLETVQEAMDDAGLPADRLAGSSTGTFIGQLGSDYWNLLREGGSSADMHAMTGSASRAVTSGRVAYALDLRGPSLTVDTAASSSLVAVHLALQSLWSGECTTAIAGGVNLVLTPDDTVIFSEARMLAPDGRCKFGDASADGFVRSDGVGAVILKPLDQALADGDRVRAVVVGSAAGNDGQTSGYLVTPGITGQQQVLRRAYRHAGIDPADVDYVEAHGTGTRVGDSVELRALASVLGEGRPSGRPCWVGSVKTNIGHAEAAAGIAGFIKTVLCLQHRTVPPSLHVNEPNPAVEWEQAPLRLARGTTPLDPPGRPALAGVSSFGFSGTNAHVVLRAFDGTEDSAPADEAGDRTEVLRLSASDRGRLRDLAAAWTRYLAPGGAGRRHAWGAVTRSAALRRQHGACRLAITAASHEEALAALHHFTQGEQPPDSAFTEDAPHSAGRIAFVYPGQGGQWIGMGRQLLATEPVFAEAISTCDAAIQHEAGWSLTDLLRAGTEEQFTRLAIVQPALWAIETALTALWRHWGAEPDVVIGHSMGEAAAAHAAGALSLADSAAVICRRSELAERLSGGQGTMAWVRLNADDAVKALAGHEEHAWVAARNSPASTLLSGERQALTEILEHLDRLEVPNRWVNVDFASHCPHMDEVSSELANALQDIRPRQGTVPIHSTVHTKVVDGSGMDAGYWASNIRQPVDFAGAVSAEITAGTTLFIEISPHPVLVHSIRDIAGSLGQQITAVASLRREEDERRALLTSLAELSTRGLAANWPRLYTDHRHIPLPPTPWRRSSYWLPGQSRSSSMASQEHRRPAGGRDAAPSGAWLVLTDSGPRGRALSAALRARGQQVVVATVATTFKQTGTDRYRMNPDRPDDFRSLLKDVSRRGPCPGIVHLWGLDAVLPQDATAKETERAQVLALRSVTHLLNALHHAPFEVPPRIWLIDQDNGPSDAEAFLDSLGIPAAPPPPPPGTATSPGRTERVKGPAVQTSPHRPQAPHEPDDTGRRPAQGRPLEEILIEQVGEVLSLGGRSVSTEQPLRRMGLDSLMSVELRHRLERHLNVRLSLEGLLGQHTIQAIAADIREQRTPHPDAASRPEPAEENDR